MKPVHISLTRITALFILTGILAWFVPLPNTPSPLSAPSHVSH